MLLDHLTLDAVAGTVRIRKMPSDMTEADFAAWWPRVSEKDRSRYSVGLRVPKMVWNHYLRRYEWNGDYDEREDAHNLITNNGILSLLQLIVYSNQSQLQPYQQIMSAGNGAITGVQRTDIAVAGDGFASGSRKVPNLYQITGFTGVHSTLYGSGDALGTWTNIGWYGYNFTSSQNATTTSGTGWLNTHCLFSFVKDSYQYTVDYANTITN